MSKKGFYPKVEKQYCPVCGEELHFVNLNKSEVAEWQKKCNNNCYILTCDYGFWSLLIAAFKGYIGTCYEWTQKTAPHDMKRIESHIARTVEKQRRKFLQGRLANE